MVDLKNKIAKLFGVRPSSVPMPGLAELAAQAALSVGPTVDRMVGPWRRFGVSFTAAQQTVIESHLEEGTPEGLEAAQAVIVAELERCYG